jgi:hypothetical protein
MGGVGRRDAPATVDWRLPALLAVAAAPRLWAAIADHGIVWPDEIYQSLEPAHYFAFGYGVLAWEFEEGARSWLFPAVIGTLLKALDAAGLHSAIALVTGAKLAMAGVSLLGVYGTVCLARRLGGEVAGWSAGLFAAAFPALLVFGSRCMAEVASGTLLVFAALALVRRGRHDAWLAGTMAAVAVFLRYPNGLVLLGFAAMLLGPDRRENLRRFLLASLAIGALGGLLDWATWGAPFHSLRAYVAYNVEHQAALYGTAPAWFYGATGWTATGPAFAVLACGVLVAVRRWPGLALTALGYVAVHSAIGHKELRFLLPVLPLLLALAAAGMAAVPPARVPRRLLMLGAGVLAAAMAHRATVLTFADIGQYRGQPAGALSPWHAGEGANRLLWVAGRQADLCGLWLSGIRPAWTGGYSYLHRRVPIVVDDAAASAAAANYALMPLQAPPRPLAVGPAARLPAEYTPFAAGAGWILLRRPGGCAG